MKTSMNQENKGARHNDYPQESLSVKDALIWFVITVVALCIAGTSHAQKAIVKVNASFFYSTKNNTYTATAAHVSSLSDNNYQYSFGAAIQASNHIKKLDSFSIGAENYPYAENAISTVTTRRLNNNVAPGNPEQYRITIATAPIAYDVTMTPLVQASIILPLNASSENSIISAYIFQTIPSSNQGILSIDMNSVMVPVSEGMMLTADLASKLVFEPDTAYTGNVIFTYSATDEEGNSSNTASYTIPVIAKQQAVLPVSLLGFTGTVENNFVVLYWHTQNEGNSSHFEIQRSSDGNNFETIAMVTAKGNISNANNYQTKDDLFFYNYPSVYYRLKMIGINGHYKYSNAILIKLKAETKNNITAWPLPFTSNINISYYSEVNETVKITINGINGSVLMSLNSSVKKGINTISLYQAQQMPAGIYLLSVGNSTKAATIKVIKQ